MYNIHGVTYCGGIIFYCGTEQPPSTSILSKVFPVRVCIRVQCTCMYNLVHANKLMPSGRAEAWATNTRRLIYSHKPIIVPVVSVLNDI